MWNQKGASLVEILILISIIAVTSTFLLLQFTGTKNQVEFELLVDQLQRDINWALYYADVNQKPIYLNIVKGQFSYYFQAGKDILLLRTYDKRFIIEDNLNNHQLGIDGRGTVTNFGHLKIYIGSKLFATLNIQMLTGVVREEKH